MAKTIRHQPDEHLGEGKPRLARMVISDELLRQLIPMPEHVKVLGSGAHEGEVEIVISAPEFPEVEPGDELPIVAPRHELRNGEPVFVEWGGL